MEEGKANQFSDRLQDLAHDDADLIGWTKLSKNEEKLFDMRHAMPVRHGALVRPRDAGPSPFMSWFRFCVAGRRRRPCICWMALFKPIPGMDTAALRCSLTSLTKMYAAGSSGWPMPFIPPRHCFHLSGGPRQRRSPPMDRYLGTRRYLREIIRVTKPPSHWPRLSFE